MDSEEKDIELRKFYATQRDKHLQQIMSINGRGSFGTLTIVASILVGGLGIKKDEIGFNPDDFLILFLFLVVGIILLFSAAAMYSYFHTSRMREFEKLVRFPIKFNDLKCDSFKIMPHKITNYFVFFGLIFLLIGSLGILTAILMCN